MTVVQPRVSTAGFHKGLSSILHSMASATVTIAGRPSGAAARRLTLAKTFVRRNDPGNTNRVTVRILPNKTIPSLPTPSSRFCKVFHSPLRIRPAILPTSVHPCIARYPGRPLDQGAHEASFLIKGSLPYSNNLSIFGTGTIHLSGRILPPVGF